MLGTNELRVVIDTIEPIVATNCALLKPKLAELAYDSFKTYVPVVSLFEQEAVQLGFPVRSYTIAKMRDVIDQVMDALGLTTYIDYVCSLAQALPPSVRALLSSALSLGSAALSCIDAGSDAGFEACAEIGENLVDLVQNTFAGINTALAAFKKGATEVADWAKNIINVLRPSELGLPAWLDVANDAIIEVFSYYANAKMKILDISVEVCDALDKLSSGDVVGAMNALYNTIMELVSLGELPQKTVKLIVDTVQTLLGKGEELISDLADALSGLNPF